jgi:hypothetical protein
MEAPELYKNKPKNSITGFDMIGEMMSSIEKRAGEAAQRSSPLQRER